VGDRSQRTAAPDGLDESPLVSVVIPVRNGAPEIRLVLDGLLRQSYRNVEFLISDNASSDSTGKICLEAMSRDSRVHYVRQRLPLPAIENFRVRLKDARGEYVLFAAHDDLRNRDFLQALVVTGERRQDASCVVPAISRFSEYTASPFEVADPVPEQTAHFSTDGLGLWQRLGFGVVNGFPCYGLIRRDAALAYPWFEIDYAPDMPFVVFLALHGEIVVAEAATLYYWMPAVQKSPAERAVANSLKRLKPFPEVRLAWACGRAAAAACRARGRRLPVLFGFVAALLYRVTPGLRGAAYDLAPQPIRALWRALKVRIGWRLN
jgi:glycosyltransferase involved in cell wall biosynthesis